MEVNGRMISRALMASLVLVMGCGRGDARAQAGNQTQATGALRNVPTQVDTSVAAAVSAAFRSAAARALPGVVTVQVTEKPQQTRTAPFPFPFPFGQQPQFQQPPVQHGTGSGFVYSKDGYIITNNHVVANATSVQVRFVDGRVFDNVQVVGADPKTDIAVIKLKGDSFQPLEIGNSEQAQVGDWVLALGNPLDIGFTVTAGIISAKGRRLGIIHGEAAPGGTVETPPLEAFIQTDAAINPGNSGGPLVDLLGRVIAVNTAIVSGTGEFAGIGFAIPSAIAVKAANDIIKYGYVRRPRLGVVISPVGEAQAELYHLPKIAGAVVNEVESNSPAAKAGIQPQDVIVSLNGKPVQSADQLTASLAVMSPGEKVTLGIIRDGRQRNVEVTLGQFPTQKAGTGAKPQAESAEQKLGVGVADLTPDIRDQLTLQKGIEGVVVTQVAPFGPAAGVLQRGDVIMDIDNKPVSSVSDVRRVASDLKSGDVVVLRVRTISTGNVGVFSYRIP